MLSAGQGRHEEGPHAVQHAHGEGSQGDEKKEGKHPPGEGHRKGGFDRIESRGHNAHQERRQDDTGKNGQARGRQEDGKGLSGKPFRRFSSPVGQDPGKDRNERSGKGSLGEKLPGEVRESEGHVEGIKYPRGTEPRGGDDLPDQAENPARQRSRHHEEGVTHHG